MEVKINMLRSRLAILSASVALTFFGCGDQTTPMTSSLYPETSASTTKQTRSWILSEAAGETLLYVANDNGTVTVYNYPKGKVVGRLFGFDVPLGECSDKNGNVFIEDIDLHETIEYAHGRKNPSQILNDNGYDPWDCSVDPTTGNLAVTNEDGPSGYGNLLVYRHAKGVPKVYTDSDIGAYYSCAYDSAGNLFLDGVGQSKLQFSELPKGRRSFISIRLSVSGLDAGIQWDGKYVTVGQPLSTIYRFQVVGNNATEVGSVRLNGAADTFYWIDGSKIMAEQGGANVGVWHYPVGGDPTKIIYRDTYAPTGVTISVAPSSFEH